MSFLDPEPDDDDPFATDGWPVPWHAHVPGALLAAGMTAAWLLHFPGGMREWGISGAALAEGRYETIALHMAAHGPLAHIVMNMAAIISIGGPLVTRFGPPPAAWLRFLTFFVLSGLAGSALYLAVHPHGTMPMLGASGALYGLIGLLLRLPPESGPLLSLRTPRMRQAVIALIKDNLWLFALLVLPALLLGAQGGLAWEAHLGGFLFGLFAGPLFLPKGESGETSPTEPTAPMVACD
jgi:membrane associated rhomboid family serine protease